MGDAVEGGATLAWRLLATLEGGSLVLAASALLAYTARHRARRRRARRTVHTVLITNTSCTLGRELKSQFESRGVVVSTGGASKVDALVVVGAEPRPAGLDGMAGLVSEDVYVNLKMLDTLSPLVRRGGYLAWACAGADAGAFSGAAEAFDAVLQASLRHAAKNCHCEPMWVGRCEVAERAAERVVAALVPCTTTTHVSRFSIRNAAFNVSNYIGRWFKIVT